MSIADIQSSIRSRHYDDALQLIRTGLRETPADFKLWTLEGIVFSLEGSNNDALNAFDKALSLSPDYAPALKGAVQLLYATQDVRAIPLLKKILKADPRDETAHEMLANLEKKQGNCPAAIEQFVLSADTVDTHPESLGAYGYCLVETRQPAKAVPVFEKLTALLPQQTFPRYDLAVVLVAAKQESAALKILEPLLASNPSDPDLLSLASEAYEATGNTPRLSRFCGKRSFSIRAMRISTRHLQRSASITIPFKWESIWSTRASSASPMIRLYTCLAACSMRSLPITTRRKPTSAPPSIWMGDRA